MGVIKRVSAVPVTAIEDVIQPEEQRTDHGLTDNGMTTDDGGSEFEGDLVGLPVPVGGNDALNAGRIRLFASRRSVLRNGLGGGSRSRCPAIPSNTTPQPRLSTHGSKKFRRYENHLELLKECDESELSGEVTIEDFVGPSSPRIFGRVLQEKNLLNSFNTLVDAAIDTSRVDRSAMGRKPIKMSASGNPEEFDPEVAFQGICRKLRVLLKQRKFPLGMMEAMEESLLEFFADRPSDTFESDPMDAFRRGILHAISQYNNLRSHSIKCKDAEKESHKVVRIQPSGESFSPPPVPLVVYLESKYNSRGTAFEKVSNE